MSKASIKALLSNRTVWLAASLAILTVAVLYSGIKASVLASNNADAIVSSYISAEPYSKGALHLGSAHSNIFKFPLLAVQGGGDYDYNSFMAVNVGLLAITIFGWIALLAVISGRRYVPAYALGATFLLMGSTAYAPELIYTTIRNVDFPLLLLFVVLVNRFITKGRWLWLALYTPVFVAVVASDLFNMFVAVPAMMIAGALAWLQTKKTQTAERKRMLIALALTAATALAAKALLALLVKFEILTLVEDGGTALAGLQSLTQGTLTTFQALLQLMGVDIFSQALSAEVIARALFMVLALVVLTIYVRRMPVWFKNINESPYRFTFASLALMVIITIALYIFSGRWDIPNTKRYMALLPLIFLVVLPLVPEYIKAWVQKASFISADQKKWLLSTRVLICAVLIVVAAFGYLANTTRKHYAASIANIQGQRQFFEDLQAVADREDAHQVLAGFWQGSPIQFWTQDKLTVATIAKCNQPMPYLSHAADYKPTGERSLLVIDRKGSDGAVWEDCKSDKAIMAYYGTPESTHRIEGMYGEQVDVWVYGTDLLPKLNMRSY